MNWHDYFRKICFDIAEKSKDTGVKVGVVITSDEHIILSTGFNGFPRGVMETYERTITPEKFYWNEHAEKNAIFNAARLGVKLQGSVLYATWAPCAECARAIIQAGIAKVIILSPPPPEHSTWSKSCKKAIEMFREAEVDICWRDK